MLFSKINIIIPAKRIVAEKNGILLSSSGSTWVHDMTSFALICYLCVQIDEIVLHY